MGATSLASADGAAGWLQAQRAGMLHADHRQLRPGDAFLAWPGRHHDARRFVGAALRDGAAACLVEAGGSEAFGFDDARIATLPGLQQHSGPIAHRFFGRPSEALTVVAATGTNGKTSTTWWTAQALGLLGRRSAVLGTLGVGAPGAAAGLAETGLTTPDAVALQRALRRLVDQGFAACAIEASSIGLHQHRLDGTRIEVALFSNLTLDHLDYHGSMHAYGQAKRLLFRWPGLRSAVINVDDAFGAALADELSRSGPDVWRCSARGAARLSASAVGHVGGGLNFAVHEQGQTHRVGTTLVGAFNVSNLLLVIGALRALGVDFGDAAQAVSRLGPVPGRMQRVALDTPALPEVVVDYAHTPDALEQALRALRPFAQARGGALWCVFGCGGNRDVAKRPLMGAIAARLADHVLLTSDNPRDEDPGSILAQIRGGIGAGQVQSIEDRREAIADATRRAAAPDVILLAGKGHETWQEAAGVKRPFSDADEALAALRRRAGVAP